MKGLYPKIFKLILSRPARNLYFWVFMIYIVWHNDTRDYVYAPSVYHECILILMALLIVFSFVNNLWLMPRYLATKKYVRYFLFIAIATYVFSLIFIFVVKTMMMGYPKLLIHHISLISTPVNTDWSFFNVLSEVQEAAFGYGLWILIMSMAWYVHDYTRQQKLLEATQQKQIQTELHFLKNQVNPHFLFNTLNNLYGLALKKSDTAPDAILKLSAILRYMLYESNSARVSFEKEKEIMNAYINLEMLRLPEKQDFHITIQADKDYLVPPLLWLPVLENVFKHATRVITDKYFIDYNVKIINNVLTIQSRNNYKLPANSDENNNSGIGLENLRKRLDLLYPGKYTFDAKPDGDLYSVNIQIHL